MCWELRSASLDYIWLCRLYYIRMFFWPKILSQNWENKKQSCKKQKINKKFVLGMILMDTTAWIWINSGGRILVQNNISLTVNMVVLWIYRNRKNFALQFDNFCSNGRMHVFFAHESNFQSFLYLTLGRLKRSNKKTLGHMEEDNINQTLLTKEKSIQDNGVEDKEEDENLPLKNKVWRETKKMWVVAGPAIFTRVSTFGINVISQAFIGHIGSTQLAAFSLVFTVLVRFANGILVRLQSSYLHKHSSPGQQQPSIKYNSCFLANFNNLNSTVNLKALDINLIRWVRI